MRDQPDTSTYPLLYYRDVEAAGRWLAMAFGLESAKAGTRPDGTTEHAELRAGSGVVMLLKATDDGLGMKSPRDTGTATDGVYVNLADVHAHYWPVQGGRRRDHGRPAGHGVRLPRVRRPRPGRASVSFGTYRPARNR